MPDMKDTVANALLARYAKLAGVVCDLAAPLTNEQFWSKPFAFGNSFGHLILHLTGNLNHYIGSGIAETGYVRDRPREFTEAAPPAKDVVMKKFDEAVQMVLRTIRAQAADDWSKPYAAAGADAKDRFEMVLQCATHLDHHVGQLMYLAFELKRQT
jgi:DinB superfamily